MRKKLLGVLLAFTVLLCGATVLTACGTNKKEVEEENVVKISTYAELAALGEIVDYGSLKIQAYEMYDEGTKFVLTADIDCGGKVWQALGTYDHAFTYEFDGAGHTISNFKLTLASSSDAALGQTSLWYFIGFFGGVEEAYIHDLTLDEVIVDIDIADHYSNTGSKPVQSILMFGGLVGRAGNENLDYSTIENIVVNYTSFSIKSDKVSIGGVIGYDNFAKDVAVRKNLSASGNLTVVFSGNSRMSIGGIVGEGIQGDYTYENCAFKGTINATNSDTTGEMFVGGIFGLFKQANVIGATFKNCVAQCTISSINTAGLTNVIGGIFSGIYSDVPKSFWDNLELADCTIDVTGYINNTKVTVLQVGYEEISA